MAATSYATGRGDHRSGRAGIDAGSRFLVGTGHRNRQGQQLHNLQATGTSVRAGRGHFIGCQVSG